MSTPSIPAIPTRKSLDSKVKRYKAGADAHRAGKHDDLPRQRFCVLCSKRAA